MKMDDLELELEGSGAIFLMPREVFDTAIIGTVECQNGRRVVAYAADLVVHALMAAHGWDANEACEWYEANTVCSYMGAGTPVFVQLCTA